MTNTILYYDTNYKEANEICTHIQKDSAGYRLIWTPFFKEVKRLKTLTNPNIFLISSSKKNDIVESFDISSLSKDNNHPVFIIGQEDPDSDIKSCATAIINQGATKYFYNPGRTTPHYTAFLDDIINTVECYYNSKRHAPESTDELLRLIRHQQVMMVQPDALKDALDERQNLVNMLGVDIQNICKKHKKCNETINNDQESEILKELKGIRSDLHRINTKLKSDHIFSEEEIQYIVKIAVEYLNDLKAGTKPPHTPTIKWLIELLQMTMGGAAGNLIAGLLKGI
ncbi:MAG: hypothetical protein HQL53_08475 [Magnetococcales bacterium]|nr:hypothetical protein [Magnetococcales bacterium]